VGQKCRTGKSETAKAVAVWNAESDLIVANRGRYQCNHAIFYLGFSSLTVSFSFAFYPTFSQSYICI